MIPRNPLEVLVSYVTQVFTDLVRVETRLYNAAGARLRAEHDLGLGQFEFLEIIDRVPGCRVLDIVAELAITVGAVSKAVDRLEAAGWCERHAHPQDRRSSVLRLTPAGERVLAAARPTLERELAALTASVPPAALAQLAGTLSALRATLEAAAEGRPG
jgi:DNA-binding MarR family transcriptional regulator